MIEPIAWPEALRMFARIAMQSFGGPAGQIAVMHRELVEREKWISEARFLHALNYCTLLPGPEAMQLITYFGWLAQRTRGALAAGLLFVLPGFVSLFVLSVLYAKFQNLSLVQGLFLGVKSAVLVVVVEAVLRIGKRVLKNGAMLTIAVLAFVGIFFFGLPFPWIVLAAGSIGFLGGRFWPERFCVIQGKSALEDPNENARIDLAWRQGHLAHTVPHLGRTLKRLVFWLLLWLGPVALLHAILGPEQIFSQQALFFSKAAVVTFGGAYSVLAYIAQQAVDVYGWLEPGEMLDGLGLAESTPGPLIQVVQFVGFLGAYREPGSLSPLMAGFLSSLLVTWVTYAPCFLFILVGAPYVESLRGNRLLSSSLSAITAAVVGVVLNLGLWFGLRTLFQTVQEQRYGPLHLQIPEFSTLHWPALGLTLLAAWLLLWRHFGLLKTLAICGALGFLLGALSLG